MHIKFLLYFFFLFLFSSFSALRFSFENTLQKRHADIQWILRSQIFLNSNLKQTLEQYELIYEF